MANCEQAVLKHIDGKLMRIRLEESPVPYVGTVEVVEPVLDLELVRVNGLRKLHRMREEAAEKNSGKVLGLEDIDPEILEVLPGQLKENLIEGNNMIIDIAGNLIPCKSYKANQT